MLLRSFIQVSSSVNSHSISSSFQPIYRNSLFIRSSTIVCKNLHSFQQLRFQSTRADSRSLIERFLKIRFPPRGHVVFRFPPRNSFLDTTGESYNVLSAALVVTIILLFFFFFFFFFSRNMSHLHLHRRPKMHLRCIFSFNGGESSRRIIGESFTRQFLLLSFHYCRRQHLHLGFFFKVTCSTCEASPGPCAVILATSTVAALDDVTTLSLTGC